MGRKSKLTKELIHEAENLIKLGNYTDTVCDYLGIHRSTWYKWLQEGEKASSGLKKDFFDTIKKAEAHAEMRNIKNIQTSAQDGNWQASAWYLERKFPHRWGKKDRADLAQLEKKVSLQLEKMQKEIEFLEARTSILKGSKKDTSLLEALINVVSEKGGD